MNAHIMKRLERVRSALENREKKAPLLCQLPDGTEKAMTIFEALTAGARFIRTVDGNHDKDALYVALLNTENMDFSDISELNLQ